MVAYYCLLIGSLFLFRFINGKRLGRVLRMALLTLGLNELFRVFFTTPKQFGSASGGALRGQFLHQPATCVLLRTKLDLGQFGPQSPQGATLSLHTCAQARARGMIELFSAALPPCVRPACRSAS